MRFPLILLWSLLVLTACGGDKSPQIPANKLPADHTKENLLEFNKQYMEFEEEEIGRYVDSLKLQMQTSKSGIRYRFLSVNGGTNPREGDVVNITYTVSLLNGKACDALTDKTTTVELGKGKLPKGIEWGVMSLAKGDKIDLIIPAMLAYGVSGREDCIPPYSPVRCLITLNEFSKAK